MTTSAINSSSVASEGLPKQFVTSLRILFDILDEDRSGFVNLRDIETRWHEEGVSGLPSGVIEALRKVAPRNGKLSFENFVTGLKLSLLKKSAVDPTAGLARNKANPPEYIGPKPSSTGGKLSKNNKQKGPPDYVNIGPVTNSGGNKTVSQKNHGSQPKGNGQVNVPNKMAAVRPNNVLQSQNIELRNQIYTREQQQQASMKSHIQAEHYTPDHSQIPTEQPYNRQLRYTKETQRHRHNIDTNAVGNEQQRHHRGQRPKSAHDPYVHLQEPKFARTNSSSVDRPERPPPYRKPHEQIVEVAPVLPPRNINSRIMSELKAWHKEHQNIPSNQRDYVNTMYSDHKQADRNALYVNIEQIRKHEASQSQATRREEGVPGTRKPPRRQNSRRHTLSSGVDYNMIRRMKQLELEKDVLLQGLEVVERAREWYLEQITAVTEKQNFADKTSCTEMTLQSHQERMDFIRSRITDVNMNLKTLMETSKSGFPAHMNLAIRSNTSHDDGDKSLRWLKEQNKQLTHEVGEKSDRITQLEKEKASLIRDLFEARSKHKTSYDDTTFM